jgi:hypothetical protein
MSAEELRNEVKSGVQFYGRVEENNIVAVMGMQYVKDLTLIRHAYVLRHSERELGKISLNTSCNCQINLKFWLELGRQLGGRYISTKRMVSFLNRKQRRIDF